MAHVMIRHKVEDYNRWKPYYEEHKPARDAAGLKTEYVGHNKEDPHEVVLLMEAEDLEKAKAFADSEDLKDVMMRAGVQGPPEITYLE